MSFVSSSGKAPNVFISVIDDTGAPSPKSGPVAGPAVITMPSNPTPPIPPSINPLTVDSTVFTVDNNAITIDMIEY